jgi:transposase
MSKSKRTGGSGKSSAVAQIKVRYEDGLNRISGHAAGIDVGSEEHWVCVPYTGGDAAERVRRFGALTCDLLAIRDWLKERGVTSVAMESTGVYWIALYQILEEAGLDVWLVNARYIKRVPGRPKTDRLDCEWIQRLHSYGLMRRSFRPANDICAIRSLWRYRDRLIDQWSRCVKQIQKALHEMNVLLHKAVSDITGKTGTAILEAIVQGERDPVRLARFRDPRVKASESELAEALRGDFREELVLIVASALRHLRFTESEIATLDAQIEQRMGGLQPRSTDIGEAELVSTDLRRNSHQHAPGFDAVHLVQRLYGVPLGDVPGLSATTLTGILSEVGLDLSQWENAKHFASWLSLSPTARISGGRIIASARTAGTANRAGRYFRQAASSLKHNDTPLGEFYRRMRSRNGTKHAIVSTARKLAEIFYTMVTTGNRYRYLDNSEYDQKLREMQIRNLRRRAAKLGMELREAEPQQPKTA